MSRVFTEPVIQPLTNLSGKGRPNKARKPSHIEPFVIEQLAFPSAQGFSLRKRGKSCLERNDCVTLLT